MIVWSIRTLRCASGSFIFEIGFEREREGVSIDFFTVILFCFDFLFFKQFHGFLYLYLSSSHCRNNLLALVVLLVNYVLVERKGY